jgi:hypothetical protein
MNEDLMYAMHVAEECKKRAEQAEARVKELERWRDAVLSIVDGLDDPPVGLTWLETTHATCAFVLEHLRSVLVPLVRGEEER